MSHNQRSRHPGEDQGPLGAPGADPSLRAVHRPRRRHGVEVQREGVCKGVARELLLGVLDELDSHAHAAAENVRCLNLKNPPRLCSPSCCTNTKTRRSCSFIYRTISTPIEGRGDIHCYGHSRAEQQASVLRTKGRGRELLGRRGYNYHRDMPRHLD